MTSEIWLKVEVALQRVLLALPIGALVGAHVYRGSTNDSKILPHIVCECHAGEPLVPHALHGNWICPARITITHHEADETVLDHSARFNAVVETFLASDIATSLSSVGEAFTCFHVEQPPTFNKRLEGKELVSEIELRIHCCGSVIT